MTTDLLTIEPVLLILGAGALGLVLYATQPWHKPEQWREAPVEIRAFMWFSLCVAAIELVVFGSLPDLRDSWNQYLGRGQTHVYLFGGPAAMVLCRSRVPLARWMLIGFIGLWVVLSLFRFESHPQRPGETDPSRMVSPYQLIWTVGIPLLWMLVLLSPRVKRYCTGAVAVAV
jgi:hypothetical protein